MPRIATTVATTMSASSAAPLSVALQRELAEPDWLEPLEEMEARSKGRSITPTIVEATARTTSGSTTIERPGDSLRLGRGPVLARTSAVVAVLPTRLAEERP